MRAYVILVVAAGLLTLPIAWWLHPLSLRLLPEALFLALGTQVAALMPIRWTQGRQYVFLPLLLAAGLVAPGAGVGLIAWLCLFDGRVPGRTVAWWAFLFNRAMFCLTYAIPSLLLLFIPPIGVSTLPIKTILFTVAIVLINYPLMAISVARMNRVPLMQALIDHIGLSTLRSMLVLGFLGGVLYQLLDQPVGYVMAAGLFGLLLAVRANLEDVQRQAEARRQTLRLAAQALDARDAYTESHSERVADLAARLGEVLGLRPRQLDQLRDAGTLHDLGKIGIPDRILNTPNKLTDEEWREMKRHPDIGADMIAKHSSLVSVASMVRHHHERWNGEGYPAGLKRHEIPLGSRIIAVADSFDTLTTPRIYRSSVMTAVAAVSDITARAGEWYDPLVVDALRNMYGLPSLKQSPAAEPQAFQRAGTIELLRTNRRFRRLVTAIGISGLGDPLTTVATLIAIYAATHQPIAVAAGFIVQALATILIGASLGGLPDRISRRRLLVVLEFSRATLLLALPVLLHISVSTIFPALFVLAAINALAQPTRQAAVADLVNRDELGRANATIAMFTMLSLAMGFPLAALIIWATSNTNLLFVFDAITFMVSGLLASRLGDIGGGFERVSLSGAIRRAWAVVPARVHILVMGGAALFISMSFPALVSLAYQFELPGAEAYTVLQGALGVGVVVGSIMISRLRAIGTMRTVAIGLMVNGAFCFGVAGSPSIAVAVVLLFCASVGNPVYTVANQTALLEMGSPQNRGSLMTTRFALGQTALIVGVAIGGELTTVAGPRFTYILLGAGLLVMGVLAGWAAWRAAWRLGDEFAQEARVESAGHRTPSHAVGDPR